MSGAPETAVLTGTPMISDITLWQKTRGEQQLVARYPLDLAHDLHDIPLNFDDWWGEETQVSTVNALIMLEPEQIVERLYVNSQGQYIWLTLIGSRQSRSFHAPTDCYYSAGWDTELDFRTIPLATGEVHGMLIDAQKADTQQASSEQQLSYYFYLFPNRQRNPNDGIVMFRLTSRTYDSVENTMQIYGAFLDEFFLSYEGSDMPIPYTPLEDRLIAGELPLDGFQLSHQSIPADDVLGVDLKWVPDVAPQNLYQATVRLMGPDGLIWSEKKTTPLAAYNMMLPPTDEWQAGETYWDRLEVSLLPGTPPGQYRVMLTVFDQKTLQPVTLLSESGKVHGPDVELGMVSVTAVSDPIQFTPQKTMDTTLPGRDLHLIGIDQGGDQIIPGQSLLLTFYWQAMRAPREVAHIFLDLIAENGEVVHTWELPPVRDDYPPAVWQKGEFLRGQHLITMPPALTTGTYRFSLSGVPLGEIAVQAPERVMEMPEVETAVSAQFNHQINLVGYMLQENQLRLVWQTSSEISERYRVFVHLVNEAGDIVAQSDGEPAAWERPTTSWAPQEYIVDAHVLDFPDKLDGLTLLVGLYHPETGQRLLSATGDFVQLDWPENVPND